MNKLNITIYREKYDSATIRVEELLFEITGQSVYMNDCVAGIELNLLTILEMYEIEKENVPPSIYGFNELIINFLQPSGKKIPVPPIIVFISKNDSISGGMTKGDNPKFDIFHIDGKPTTYRIIKSIGYSPLPEFSINEVLPVCNLKTKHSIVRLEKISDL